MKNKKGVRKSGLSLNTLLGYIKVIYKDKKYIFTNGN